MYALFSLLISTLSIHAQIPGLIEAEDFDPGGPGVAYFDTTAGNNGDSYRAEDVDIQTADDVLGGGFNIGWTTTGEWLQYTVSDITPGDYYFMLRVARRPSGTSDIEISIDGEIVDTISALSTGDWQTYVTLNTAEQITFDGSPVVIRITFLEGNVNLNWIETTDTLPENDLGFPNVPQTEGAILGSAYVNGASDDVRTVVMTYFDKYLFMESRSVPADGEGGATQVWDISNPTSPVEVTRIGQDRIMHTSFVHITAAGEYYLINSTRNNRPGKNFVNITNPLNPVREIPPGHNPDDFGTRGAHLLPYQYSGGSTIRIYNTLTGERKEVSDHGFEGQPTLIGNLMVVMGVRGQSRQIATYDVGDPMNPEFKSVLNLSSNTAQDPDSNPAYEPAIWKHYAVFPNVLSGSNADDVAFIDFSDPMGLEHVVYSNGDGTYGTGLPGRTRYAQFQDNFMFVGSGKYNLTPIEDGGEPVLDLAFLEQNGEYLLPMGNLLMSAENTEQGSIPDAAGPYPFQIIAHQTAPDETPPTIAYHIPRDGEGNQHIKSRIGVVIHETLNLKTINATTFRVFPTSGGADVPGSWNVHDKDILTFTPDSDLEEATEYTVLLEGIEDVAGNAMLADSFTFTTSGAGGFPPIVLADFNYTGYPAPVGAPTPFSVSASGGDGTFEYRWSFGDGTILDWAANNASPSHTYASEGHYTAQVFVRDSSGNDRSSSPLKVTATNATVPATPPIASSQIILNSTEDTVWTVFPDNNRVLAIDTATHSIAHNIDLGLNSDPRSVAEDGNGQIWVTCIDGDRIDILSGTTGLLVDSIATPIGSRPHDIIFDAAKTFAYVSLKGSGQMLRIDPASHDLVFLDAGPTPTALAIDPSSDRLFVSRFISPDTHGEVRAYSINNEFVLDHTFTLQKDTISAENGQIGRGLPNYLAGVVISPDSQYAYVSSKKDNIDRGESTVRSGDPFTFETTSRPILSKLDLVNDTEIFNEQFDFDNSSQPTAIVFSPLGDYAFTALQGNNRIMIVDTYSHTLAGNIPSGFAPQGLLLTPSTYHLYIKNLNDRSVTVYDLTDGLIRGDFSAPPIATINLGSEIMDPDVLAGKIVFYNASIEMTQDEYISCALCHQDGDHDGRTWDFTDRGEGLRNTTNLRGRSGLAHGNVHWSANFDEIQDFEHDIIGPFGGDGFIPGGPNPPLGNSNAGLSDALDDLAAYVTSLGLSSVETSPYRDADRSLSAQGNEGKRLFEGQLIPAAGTPLNCIDCHTPESDRYTDSTLGTNFTLHDVGTLRSSSGNRLGGDLDGIDTPTLLGLHASAPYFHDGNAATLEEVFDPSRVSATPGETGNVHDLTATGFNLNTRERESLIAYLKQIDGRAIGSTSLSEWLLTWGQDLGGGTVDLDGDQFTSEAEYFYGGNPVLADAGEQIPYFFMDGDDMKFSFIRRINDPTLIYTIWSSADLEEWMEETSLPTPETNDLNEALQEAIYTIPPTQQNMFFKVSATNSVF
ncbi:MAG: Ig-like domain-containing protein [Opitutales bacterium]